MNAVNAVAVGSSDPPSLAPLGNSTGAALGSRPQLSKLVPAAAGATSSGATPAFPRTPMDPVVANQSRNPTDDFALLDEALKDDDDNVDDYDDTDRVMGTLAAPSSNMRAGGGGGMVRDGGGWTSGNDGDQGDVDDEDEYDVNENLDDAVRKVHQRALAAKFSDRPASTSNSSPSKDIQPTTVQQPEVVDDFVRNYLASKGMLSTLEAFENEWYDLALTNRLPPEDHQPIIPDVYSQVARLEGSLRAVRTDLLSMQATADRLRTQLDKATKDRDFFKLHYTRISQEKLRLAAEAKKMRQEVEQVRKENAGLNGKVESLVKERAVARMERDRAMQQVQALMGGGGIASEMDAGGMNSQSQAQQQQQQQQQMGSKARAADHGSSTSPQPPSKPGGTPVGKKRPGVPGKQQQQSRQQQLAEKQQQPTASSEPAQVQLQYATDFPLEDRYNPATSATLSMQPVRVSAVREAVSVKAHDLAVSAVAFHPRKLVLATVSDDHTWKLWNVPSGELLMTGSGHSDWIADVDFHTKGIHLATAAGDMSVKLWDFSKGQASLTLREHTQPVWSCRFHDSGHFLVSGSMDHTAKVWDLVVGKCRQTFRGHSDSVNAVTWQPYTNTFYTASGDKTVCAWDARAGLAVQSLFGHTNAVNGIAFAPAANRFATCDSDGIVKVWDPRQASGELASMDLGPHPANKLSIDASGVVVAVASNDGVVRLVNLRDGTRRELVGHGDAVQTCAFDHAQGEYLATGASDGIWKVWH